MDYEKDSLEYHSRVPRGKIFTGLSKPLITQIDLSLAYTPGVAGPCRLIAEEADLSFTYTGRGNLVAVISNGTAVLGLGNIGPYAAKPVMEGKAVLFKKFANIDVFDIEVASTDPDHFISVVKSLEPTFGGINLEDIKAPECFYIEEELRRKMQIPVFHDDQHGTAIIAAAGFLNALEISGRKIQTAKVVFSGAGAAAIACANTFLALGVNPRNLILCDSKGVVRADRRDLNDFKRKFALETPLETMAEAMRGADVFVGVSTSDILSADMLKSMAPQPIVFALSNPNPEINPELALATREDVILATGRSDYPNQVNNVLGFPYIFRGALDVRATAINEEMKLAAIRAIAALAKDDVPFEVMNVYNRPEGISFGKNYLIPKPVDPRVLLKVAPAVAAAAMESGVARTKIDLVKYEEHLESILGPTRVLMRKVKKRIYSYQKQQKKNPCILLTKGDDVRMLKAAKQVIEESGINLSLIGSPPKIVERAREIGLSLEKIKIFDTDDAGLIEKVAQALYEKRKREGVTIDIARQMAKVHDYLGAGLLTLGEVDGLICGISEPYKRALKPLLEVVGTKPNEILAGIYFIIVEDKFLVFSDCTINLAPTSEQLAYIAIQTAELAQKYTSETLRIALLSFSSFGANKIVDTLTIKKSVEIIRRRAPNLIVDGEMQVDVALDPELQKSEFPFCTLGGAANVLIFPNLAAANIGYKMVSKLTHSTPIGPILLGVGKPANVLQRVASVGEIINMIYITADQVSQDQNTLSL